MSFKKEIWGWLPPLHENGQYPDFLKDRINYTSYIYGVCPTFEEAKQVTSRVNWHKIKQCRVTIEEYDTIKYMKDKKWNLKK